MTSGMKFLDHTHDYHVFTTFDLYEAVDSKAAAGEQLRLAVKSGAVERVRRGLLVSNRGRFEGAPVDQAEVVAALDAGAAISYHSALEAHGVARNVGFVCHFRSDAVRTGFMFRGVAYRPCGPVGSVRSETLRSSAGACRVTTKEQTVADCLGKSALAGGAEEAVRSLTAFATCCVPSSKTEPTAHFQVKQNRRRQLRSLGWGRASCARWRGWCS